MDDLEEELPCAGVEDEDGTVDRLCRQVALKRLMDRHAIHVCVVHEPARISTAGGGAISDLESLLRELGRYC